VTLLRISRGLAHGKGRRSIPDFRTTTNPEGAPFKLRLSGVFDLDVHPSQTSTTSRK
jgi:hypothetical protein